jgi:hypothetical protein
MLKWTPKTPAPLIIDQAKLYTRRVFLLVGDGFLGFASALYFPSNSIQLIIAATITGTVFLVLYIRWRKFFFSYWSSTQYGNVYYEDYSLRDSLVMGAILIIGLIILGLGLFLTFARADSTKIQPFALWLQKFILIVR